MMALTVRGIGSSLGTTLTSAPLLPCTAMSRVNGKLTLAPIDDVGLTYLRALEAL